MAVHDRAERDARQLLEGLGVTGIPVDPIKIARALGIEVWTSDLEPDVAGVLTKKAGSAPEIYINAADHPNRQRFTAAHEVGHFFERALRGEDEQPVNFVDYRDDLSSQGTNPSERYANGFAAALLMPAADVRRLHEEYCRAGVTAEVSVTLLASKFEVSSAAMRNRLDNLRLL